MEQIIKTTIVFLISMVLMLITIEAFGINDERNKLFMSFIPWMIGLMYATLAYLNQGRTFAEIDREVRERYRNR